MTGAIVGSALIGGVAASKAASKTSSAASAGAASTAQTTRETNQMQWDMFEQNRADQEPWRLAGTEALKKVQETPDFDFTQADFFADPSYQFRIDQGINALDRSAASKGRLQSGAQDKAITEYGQNLASTEYGNAFNRALTKYNVNLAKDQALTGMGQSATNSIAAAGSNTAANVASNTMAGNNAANALLSRGAEATAKGYAGIAKSANQGIGNYLLYKQ